MNCCWLIFDILKYNTGVHGSDLQRTGYLTLDL